MCCFELRFFVLNYSHYTAHLESPARPKKKKKQNHLTDISKRKLSVIFFNCLLFISIYFFSLLLEKPDGKEGRSLSLCRFPFGVEAEHSCPPLPSHALTRGEDWEAAGKGKSSFRSSCPARAGRVRTVWGADLGLSPESLPQMPFDSVQRKLTGAPCDTAHLCILLWTWLFCWELSVGWVLTHGGEGTMSGKLELSPEQTRPIPQKAET